MAKWFDIKYLNGYGKEVKHYISVSKVGEVKEVLERYNVSLNDILEVYVDDKKIELDKFKEWVR